MAKKKSSGYGRVGCPGGKKIRSKGKGRGLGIGRGRGPLNRGGKR